MSREVHRRSDEDWAPFAPERGVRYRLVFEAERTPEMKPTWRRRKMSVVGEYLRDSEDGTCWVFIPSSNRPALQSGMSRRVPKDGVVEWEAL